MAIHPVFGSFFLNSLNPGSITRLAVISCLHAADLMIALPDGPQVDDGTA
jgi:hypothetical protein